MSEFNLASQAYDYASKNQKKCVKSIPKALIDKEEKIEKRLNKAKASSFRKLEIIYELQDSLSESINKYTPCQKGCSACCHYNVDVSALEIDYIEKMTSHQSNPDLAPSENFLGKPCPFLIDNACSIYEFRPFACRRHHALTEDAYWCDTERCFEHSFPLINYSGLEGAFKQLVSNHNPSTGFKDIRQYFGTPTT